MISDERLAQLADDSMICKVSWDERLSMAREIMVLRKAFNEPVVWALEHELEKAMKVNGDGMMCGFGYVTKDWTAPNTIFLYRKPALPE